LSVAAQDPATIKKQLERKVTLDAVEAPLEDVLESMTKRWGVTFVVEGGVAKRPIKLAKQADVPLGTLLQKVLDQVQGTYRVNQDHIEVIAP
jgi:hypothetical protein